MPRNCSRACATISATIWGPRSEGRDRWILRIAANALTIAARESRSAPQDRAAHAERLRSLGVSSEQELAEAIRDGLLDDRRAELAEALWATTLDKLAVANPSYHADPTCSRTGNADTD